VFGEYDKALKAEAAGLRHVGEVASMAQNAWLQALAYQPRWVQAEQLWRHSGPGFPFRRWWKPALGSVRHLAQSFRDVWIGDVVWHESDQSEQEGIAAGSITFPPKVSSSAAIRNWQRDSNQRRFPPCSD